MAQLIGTTGNDSLVGGAADDTLDGLGGNDTLIGNGGNDRLIGGAGSDSLNGGLGDDYYVVGTGDVLSDAGGIDTVESSVSWTLAAGFENLTFTGTGTTSGSGNALSNRITGSSGNNWLRGLEGDDTVLAGAGNDTIQMSSGAGASYGSDSIDGGDGVDTLDYGTAARTAVFVDLAAGTASGGGTAGAGSATVASIENVNGGGFDDRIIGSAVANFLYGFNGNDTLDGGAGNDRLEGAAGNDQYVFALVGTANADTVIGFVSGADKIVLSGLSVGANGNFAAGDARFAAGAGFNSGQDASDRVIYNTTTGQLWYDADGNGSAAAQLIATLQAAPVVTATDIAVIGGPPPGGSAINGSEGNDSLTGTSAEDTLNGFGGADTLDGIAGNDRIDGGAGNDRLLGGEGADLLLGADGDDTLDGGGGVDTLEGGAGHDRYHVTAGDIIVESGPPGASWDVVVADFSWTLGTGQDSLELVGTADANGFGNETFNTLWGNPGANLLAGRGGNDFISGGAGNDTIDMSVSAGLSYGDDDLHGGVGTDLVDFAQAQSAVVVELTVLNGSGRGSATGGGAGGAGSATLVEIENIVGGAFGDVLRGNATSNLLDGRGGDDTLQGRNGNDTLTGGSGADRFVFTDAPGIGTADVITDLASGTDKLVLDGSGYFGIGPSGNFVSGDGRFYSAAGASTGHDADDRVIYNTSTGQLFYDADGSGSGAAQVIATLQGAPSISASDIVVQNGGASTSPTFDNFSEVAVAPLSGDNEIDSLLGGALMAWDRFTPSDQIIQYTFSVTEGMLGEFPPTAFSFTEQGHTRTALAHLSDITGIRFEEVMNGDAAELHFARAQSSSAAGWYAGTQDFQFDGDGHLTHYDGDGYVYVTTGYDMTPGAYGYQVLLHEIGHAFGLSHPHDAPILLLPSLDHNHHTVMTYQNLYAPVTEYQPLDVAALQWLYGTDGLGGAGAYADGTQPQISASNSSENLIGGAGHDLLDGGGGADTLVGGSGNDLLMGYDPNSPGNDLLDGGDGDDRYYAGAGDTLTDSSGTDWIFSPVDWTLAPEFENLSFVFSSANVNGRGNEGNNTIVGNHTNNRITGLGGNDLLFGGMGYDVFDMSPGMDGSYGNDTIDGGALIDAVDFSAATAGVSIDLPAGTASGGGTIQLTSIENVIGSAFADSIRGGSNWSDLAANILQGGRGQDTISGGLYTDTFVFAEAPGFVNADLIIGFNATPPLNGGADLLRFDGNAFTRLGATDFTSGDARFYAAAGATAGHDGDDRLIYNTSNGNLYYDADGSGSGAAELVATLQGAPALQATNIKVVNGRADTSTRLGTAGNDSLVGTAAGDTLDALAGSDTLDGLSGNDNLIGGSGADRFLFSVSPGAANADVISDFLAGLDKIVLDAAAHANLGTNGNFAAGDARFFAGAGASSGQDASDRVVYNSTTGQLFYDADGNGTGSAQLIATLQGAPSLSAVDIEVMNGSEPPPPTGGQTISGTTGNDTLVGGAGNDSINGNTGADLLQGLGGNDSILGGAGWDTLQGGDGNDLLNAQGWSDTLTGGAGSDSFVWTEAGTGTRDTVTDFVSGTDELVFENSYFSALGANASWSAGDGRFWAAAGATAGHDADDRLVFNTSTGNLYYDADGSGAGAAVVIATLQGMPGVSASDVTVI